MAETQNLVLPAIGVLLASTVVHTVNTKELPTVRRVFGIAGTAVALSLFNDINPRLGRNIAGLLMVSALVYSGNEIFGSVTFNTKNLSNTASKLVPGRFKAASKVSVTGSGGNFSGGGGNGGGGGGLGAGFYSPKPPVTLVTLTDINGFPMSGQQLDPASASAFQRATQLAGKTIRLTGAYRSLATEQAMERSDPANNPPGLGARSYHVQGKAIDVVNPEYANDPSIVRALSQAGWTQFNRTKEPWHWSYGGTG